MTAKSEWSAIVLAFRPSTRHVLALSRGFDPRNPALPGGDAEPEDKTPADTAARELLEETGLQALELKFFEQWVGQRGQPVYAFIATNWRGRRLRASNAGKPYWTSPKTLFVKTAEFGEIAQRLFDQLGRMYDATTENRPEEAAAQRQRSA